MRVAAASHGARLAAAAAVAEAAAADSAKRAALLAHGQEEDLKALRNEHRKVRFQILSEPEP
jgi:hypothetical protein